MPVPTIDVAFKNTYRAGVISQMQQKESKLVGTVTVEAVSGESIFVDRLAPTAAVDKDTRHMDTPHVNPVWTKRKLNTAPKVWSTLIDKADKVRTLLDPQGYYTQEGVKAMNRAKDDIIIAAARGYSYGGKDGTTAIELPSGQKIPHGAAKLTMAKVLAAMQILYENEADPDEERFFLYTPSQLTYLLTNVAEIKNRDYIDSVQAIRDGKISRWLGFTWIMTNRLPFDATSTYQYMLAYLRRGIIFGAAEDITTQVDALPGKCYAVQPYIEMDVGATRVEEEAVVEIECQK